MRWNDVHSGSNENIGTYWKVLKILLSILNIVTIARSTRSLAYSACFFGSGDFFDSARAKPDRGRLSQSIDKVRFTPPNKRQRQPHWIHSWHRSIIIYQRSPIPPIYLLLFHSTRKSYNTEARLHDTRLNCSVNDTIVRSHLLMARAFQTFLFFFFFFRRRLVAGAAIPPAICLLHSCAQSCDKQKCWVRRTSNSFPSNRKNTKKLSFGMIYFRQTSAVYFLPNCDSRFGREIVNNK